MEMKSLNGFAVCVLLEVSPRVHINSTFYHKPLVGVTRASLFNQAAARCEVADLRTFLLQYIVYGLLCRSMFFFVVVFFYFRIFYKEVDSVAVLKQTVNNGEQSYF